MDIFKFPFLSEVWGTVSEWVMVVVTGFTAYYLYQTLQSQKEVQKAQNRLLEIEQVRLRKQFESKLQYSLCQTAEIPQEIRNDVISIAVKNISENPALNFNVKYPLNKKIEIVNIRPHPIDLISNKEFPILHFLIKSPDRNSIYGFEFFVRYEDEIGTKYSQEVYFSLSEKEERKIQTSMPLMIVN